jgi:hypothetical protein
MTSLLLFPLIQASVNNTMHIINQSIKESDNMGLVPYNFEPEYAVEEHLFAETTAQPPLFSVRSQSF